MTEFIKLNSVYKFYYLICCLVFSGLVFIFSGSIFGHRFFCPPLPGIRLEIALGSICMFQLAFEGTHGKKMRPTVLKLGIV
jgi:hypothetical protein